MPQFVSNTIQAHVAAWFPESGSYKYLLLRRAADNPVYPRVWQVITGRIESGETALEAALRELKEETCLNPVKAWTLPYITQFFNPRLNEINASPVFAFLIENIDELIISTEHDAYEWLRYPVAIDRLPLPSHKEGTRIFKEYILDKIETAMFEIDLTEKLNK